MRTSKGCKYAWCILEKGVVVTSSCTREPPFERLCWARSLRTHHVFPWARRVYTNLRLRYTTSSDPSILCFVSSLYGQIIVRSGFLIRLTADHASRREENKFLIPAVQLRYCKLFYRVFGTVPSFASFEKEYDMFSKVGCSPVSFLNRAFKVCFSRGLSWSWSDLEALTLWRWEILGWLISIALACSPRTE